MIIFSIGILLILYSLATKQKYSVKVGMLFVLLILGFQEGVVGDFIEYKYTFNTGGAFAGGLNNTTKETEYSFIWLTQTLSKFMNFNVFVLLMATFQCWVMTSAIKKYADKRYQYFGVLTVFFTFNIMLIRMACLRQCYAVDVILFAYLLLGERKYLLSLIVAVVGYGFHNSSLVVLPFYLVCFIIIFLQDKKSKFLHNEKTQKYSDRKFALLVTGGLGLFYILKFKVFSSYINPFLVGLEAFQYEGYLEVMEDKSIAWWILIYYLVSTYAVSLYYHSERNLFKKYMAFLVIGANYITMAVFGFGNLQRIVIYFILFSIVVFPNTASLLRQKYGSSIALSYVIFNMVFLMYFSIPYMFSKATDNGTGFSTYRFSFLNW